MNDGWDITEAAAAHAALSGVLAGLGMVVLAIFLDRGSPPDEHDQAQLATWDQTVKLLLWSVCALVVSAIEWGGLSGYPSRDVHAAGLEAGTEPLPSVLVMDSFLAILGWACVLILVCGALAFLASMVDTVRLTGRAAPLRLAQRTFAVMAALGAYEVCLFGAMALRLAPSGLPTFLSSDVTALVVGLVVGGLAAAGQVSYRWQLVLRRSWSNSRIPYSSLRAFSACLLVSVTAFSIASVTSSESRTVSAWLLACCTVVFLVAATILATSVGQERYSSSDDELGRPLPQPL